MATIKSTRLPNYHSGDTAVLYYASAQCGIINYRFLPDRTKVPHYSLIIIDFFHDPTNFSTSTGEGRHKGLFAP